MGAQLKKTGRTMNRRPLTPLENIYISEGADDRRELALMLKKDSDYQHLSMRRLCAVLKEMQNQRLIEWEDRR